MPSVATLAQPPASLPCTTAVNFLGPPALCSFCLPLIVFRISNSVIICTVLVERVDCGVRQMGWLSIATQEISPTPVWAGTCTLMQCLCLRVNQEQPYLKAWPGRVCTQAHPCGCRQNWVLAGSWLEAALSSLPRGPLGRADGFHLAAVPCSAWHCGFSKQRLVILTLNSSCEREVCMPRCQ